MRLSILVIFKKGRHKSLCLKVTRRTKKKKKKKNLQKKYGIKLLQIGQTPEML